jgi:hypothetical protein
MLIITGPAKTQTKYEWLCALLEWTNTTRHNLITHNLWPKPETTTNQELNTMPMHEKQWVTYANSWKSQAATSKSKTLADSSTKLTTPRSISTAATSYRSNISYDPYLSTHVFTKVNIDAPKPTDNIWIGTSYVFLPIFWCSKCDRWSSHHDKLHDERIRWQTIKMHKWQNKMDIENKHSRVTMVLRNSKTEPMVETITTNYRVQHTVAATTEKNTQEMIAANHPQDIAPAPRRTARAAQTITTETVHHSMKIKRNTRQLTKLPRSTHHPRKV